MSGICIVNLKEHHLKFEQLNCLANNLVSVALLRKKGIFFHVRDYAFDIIKDGQMKNYFLLSDSFLYENCEFLEEPLFRLEQTTLRQTFDAFYDHYKFLEEIILLIFQYDVSNIELYLSTDGSVNSVHDFFSIKTAVRDFMWNLFRTVFDQQKNAFQEFRTVKFMIGK